MFEQAFMYLAFSALVFFNLLCFLGIVMIIYIMISVGHIKNKISDLTDYLRDTAINISEAGTSIAGFLAPLTLPFFRPKKSSIEKLITKFWK